MQYQPQNIRLRDGRTALFRQPAPQDAAGMIAYMKTCYGESPYLLHTPEDFVMTVEKEETFLARILDSEYNLMIVCEIGGEIAGNCQLSFHNKPKTRHRADVAIALIQKYWSRGIGTAMFEEMICLAKECGVEQLELEVMEGNDRAIRLYEKFGFERFGVRPNAIHLKDGTRLRELLMVKVL